MRPTARHLLTVLLDSNADLALRVGAARDRLDDIGGESALHSGHLLDRVQGGIHRTIPKPGPLLRLAGDLHHHGCGRNRGRPGTDREVFQVIAVFVVLDSVRHQCFQILVKDLLLHVRKAFELLEDLIQFHIIEREAQRLDTVRQGMASGVLAQHEATRLDAHRLRGHDLVGQWVLKHAVLVNACLMRKRIGPDNCLVGLHPDSGDLLEQLAHRVDLRGVDVRFQSIEGLAGFERHHQFL